jgi:hypothetical protein
VMMASSDAPTIAVRMPPVSSSGRKGAIRHSHEAFTLVHRNVTSTSMSSTR